MKNSHQPPRVRQRPGASLFSSEILKNMGPQMVARAVVDLFEATETATAMNAECDSVPSSVQTPKGRGSLKKQKKEKPKQLFERQNDNGKLRDLTQGECTPETLQPRAQSPCYLERTSTITTTAS